MKNLIYFAVLCFGLVCCKISDYKHDSKNKLLNAYQETDRNGFEVLYIGSDPKDSIFDKFPVKDSDSLEFHYDPTTHQIRIYVVQNERYVVLNENYELLWFVSR